MPELEGLIPPSLAKEEEWKRSQRRREWIREERKKAKAKGYNKPESVDIIRKKEAEVIRKMRGQREEGQEIPSLESVFQSYFGYCTYYDFIAWYNEIEQAFYELYLSKNPQFYRKSFEDRAYISYYFFRKYTEKYFIDEEEK